LDALVTATLPRSDALLHDPLVQAERQIVEAEERRKRQMHVLSSLAQGSPARIYAETS
jgi:hypothetical protein